MEFIYRGTETTVTPRASELLLSTPLSKQSLPSNTVSQNIPKSELELREAHMLTCARTYFNAHEFQRAVHLLRECVSPKARFISVYCQFLVCFICTNSFVALNGF
jgi:hypothetical protein